MELVAPEQCTKPVETGLEYMRKLIEEFMKSDLKIARVQGWRQYWSEVSNAYSAAKRGVAQMGYKQDVKVYVRNKELMFLKVQHKDARFDRASSVLREIGYTKQFCSFESYDSNVVGKLVFSDKESLEEAVLTFYVTWSDQKCPENTEESTELMRRSPKGVVADLNSSKTLGREWRSADIMAVAKFLELMGWDKL